MQSLSLFIESLGLNKKETQIYLSCLQYGLVTATTLSRISKIPRSSIYEITMKLIQQGFLAQHKKQVTSYFSATKPENLL
jgi:sugar-specific transcriptional regulator TrmB